MITCTTTPQDLANWFRLYMKLRGYAAWQIQHSDDDVSYIAPSRRVEVVLRITTIEPEKIGVSGYLGLPAGPFTFDADKHLTRDPDPHDQAELEEVLGAIRTRWGSEGTGAASLPPQPLKKSKKQKIAERRQTVAKLQAMEWTVEQIAEHLEVTDRTVSRDVKSVKRKMSA